MKKVDLQHFALPVENKQILGVKESCKMSEVKTGGSLGFSPIDEYQKVEAMKVENLLRALDALKLIPPTGHGSVELFFQDGALQSHPKIHTVAKV